ncbi:MAG: 3'-5' exonuclease, partial [Gammaproteobacteria bacterium]|nr:3'-5' exonuclease [Gammaproteobacteria bacterium]
DVLRPNQLVSINRLRRAGFEVNLTQVEWATDPNQTYAVVDIETTGGRKGMHAITEIAVVKVRNHKIVEEWSTLVNPERPIPAFITRLTGISNQMVANAPLFREVADELEKQLKDTIFVAHNVGFDYGFIKAAYQRMNCNFKIPRICTVRSARKAFPGLKSYALGKLARHFDIRLDNAHRALSDARATADLLILIQEQRQK